MSKDLREKLDGLKDGLLYDEYVRYVSHVEFSSGYISMTIVLRPERVRIGEEQRLYEASLSRPSKFPPCGTGWWSTHWDDFSNPSPRPCG